MLTWDAGRCASCGVPCSPQWRFCAKCDPIGHSKKPVPVELAAEESK
jgi:hypothetical protein